MNYLYTRYGVLGFLCVMMLLTIVGCAAVHKAIEDYEYGQSDLLAADNVRNVSNGLVVLLSYIFPEFKHFGAVLGFGITSVLTFLSGVILGKKKRRQ